MADVWMVESGDYEQRGVDLIADSLEAAVEAIKRAYAPPYIVRWEDLKDTTWIGGSGGEEKRYVRYTLTGHFEGVQGYSGKHTTSFEISPERLHTSAPSEQEEGQRG